MTLLDLARLLRKHLKLVIALPVLCAVVMAAVSVTLMGNTYTVTTSLYAQAASDTSQSENLYSDLNAGQMVANDVANLAKSGSVLSDAAKSLGLQDFNDFDVSVTSETTSRILSVSVTGKDPQKTAEAAKALNDSISETAQKAMGLKGVNVIDEPVAPDSPTGPNRKLYVAVAFLGGLFVAVALVVLQDMLDTKVHGADEVEELLDLPVIGRIPEMKGGR